MKNENKGAGQPATRPAEVEYIEAAGEIRYYQQSDGRWRYICALGEGTGLVSLEAAKSEVRAFLAAPDGEGANPATCEQCGRPNPSMAGIRDGRLLCWPCAAAEDARMPPRERRQGDQVYDLIARGRTMTEALREVPRRPTAEELRAARVRKAA
jgi:hypothetical protein